MKLAAKFLAVACLAASAAGATEFRVTQLDNGGSKLTITQSDGKAFSAPKIDDQDRFEKPAVSMDHRYAGWLALFPNEGASYSEPLYLVVLDAAKQARHFAGDFGMVYGWCFTKDSNAVVYKYQFPHGMTPIGFEMRRLKDGGLLHRFRLEPIKPDEDEAQVIRARAPAWTRCAQESAATE